MYRRHVKVAKSLGNAWEGGDAYWRARHCSTATTVDAAPKPSPEHTASAVPLMKYKQQPRYSAQAAMQPCCQCVHAPPQAGAQPKHWPHTRALE